MKARHSISAREISSPQRNMVQMKICKEDILPKVAALSLFRNCSLKEVCNLKSGEQRIKEFALFRELGGVRLAECLKILAFPDDGGKLGEMGNTEVVRMALQ